MVEALVKLCAINLGKRYKYCGAFRKCLVEDFVLGFPGYLGGTWLYKPTAAIQAIAVLVQLLESSGH